MARRLSEILASMQKEAYTPPAPPPAPPMDPNMAAAQGGMPPPPPMDPAMAAQAGMPPPPMDPAMMAQGGMPPPMDPNAMPPPMPGDPNAMAGMPPPMDPNAMPPPMPGDPNMAGAMPPEPPPSLPPEIAEEFRKIVQGELSKLDKSGKNKDVMDAISSLTQQMNELKELVSAMALGPTGNARLPEKPVPAQTETKEANDMDVRREQLRREKENARAPVIAHLRRIRGEGA